MIKTLGFGTSGQAPGKGTAPGSCVEAAVGILIWIPRVRNIFSAGRGGGGGAHTQDGSQQEPGLGGARVKSIVSRAGPAVKRPVKVPEGSARLPGTFPRRGRLELRERWAPAAGARLCPQAEGGGSLCPGVSASNLNFSVIL